MRYKHFVRKILHNSFLSKKNNNKTDIQIKINLFKLDSLYNSAIEHLMPDDHFLNQNSNQKLISPSTEMVMYNHKLISDDFIME
jgi:hypothetical protein